MVRPERRTRGDLVAAAAIVAVIAVAAALIWWTSDARASIDRPAAEPVPALKPATAVPGRLHRLWSAPSPATSTPLVVAGAVVTGDGHTVAGHDPTTGKVLWSYARDLNLCGVSWVYSYAVAVYPDSRGCGQITTIDAGTGRRGPTRSGYADPDVTLSSDGTTVLSAGDSRLELLRSDMVRMIGYGSLDARVKPNVPGPVVCRLESAQASSSQVSVLEDCPGSEDLRLTMLRPGDDEDQPETQHVALPGVSPDSGARVIAVTDTTTAIYRPTPQPVVDVIDATGTTISSTRVAGPVSPQATATHSGGLVTWWTGRELLVFDAALTYKFSVSPVGPNHPVGPATTMAGQLLVPVTSGIDVFDPQTGKGEEHLNVQRPPGDAPVIPAVAGDTVLELRGDTLVALGPG